MYDVENEIEAEEEVQSTEAGQAANPGGLFRTQDMETRMEKLTRVVRLLLLLVMGFRW
jgi:hypothetical protein